MTRSATPENTGFAGSHATPAAGLRSCARRLVLAACLVAAPVAGAQSPAGGDSTRPARVIGIVVDSAGAPLAGAEIGVLQQEKLRAVTSDSGTFQLRVPISGIVVFTARRLGYDAATFTAGLRAGHAYRVRFALTRSAQHLEGLTVRSTGDSGAWLAPFEKHREQERGTFITRQQIVATQARLPSEILRIVPGVQIVPTRGGQQQVRMTRGSFGGTCLPQIYVHGTPYSGSVDDFSADDIEAMEVYVGISEVPTDLNRDNRPVCAAIVIWTRTPGRV